MHPKYNVPFYIPKTKTKKKKRRSFNAGTIEDGLVQEIKTKFTKVS